MIGLDIHNVEKITAKRTQFETFIVIEFVVTQQDGTKAKMQLFTNSDETELEWEPEEIAQPFKAYCA
jgi:hypothetical protein